MFYCYILYSESLNRYYYGYSKDLNQRLKEHNRGKVRASKGGIPWIIHYSEVFEHKLDATQREQFFKSIKGYHFLRDSGIIPR